MYSNEARDDELIPKKVEALAGEVIIEVTCGGNHSCAVTSTGSIYTWGWSLVVLGTATGRVEYFPNKQRPRICDLSSKSTVIYISAYSTT